MKHKSLKEQETALFESDLNHIERNLRNFVNTKERLSHERLKANQR